MIIDNAKEYFKFMCSKVSDSLPKVENTKVTSFNDTIKEMQEDGLLPIKLSENTLNSIKHFYNIGLTKEQIFKVLGTAYPANTTASQDIDSLPKVEEKIETKLGTTPISSNVYSESMLMVLTELAKIIDSKQSPTAEYCQKLVEEIKKQQSKEVPSTPSLRKFADETYCEGAK